MTMAIPLETVYRRAQ